MKKIIFGITSLNLGGAERVLIDIANKLKEEYDITIFTLYGKGTLESELDEKIKLISLYDFSYDEMSKLNKKIIPIKVLTCGKSIYKKYIENKYDIQIAFLEGAITRIFKYGANTKKIVWIHNDISKVFGSSLKAKIKLKLDKLIYQKYDKIVFVSEDNKNEFNKLFKINNIEEKEQVIYNYIDKEKIIEKSKEELQEQIIDKNIPSILTIARLVPQKAIDRLISIHKRLIDEKIYHKIYVIGDGPEKEKLTKMVDDLGIKETFNLMGKRKNPYPYLKQADYFALLSEFEGYGMVIDEAKILNKKIIITKTAAVEAVKQYEKSIILENNDQAIYEGLKQILTKQINFKDTEKEFNNENLLDEIRDLLK